MSFRWIAVWLLLPFSLLNQPLLFRHERDLFPFPWYFLAASAALFVWEEWRRRRSSSSTEVFPTEIVGFIGVLLAPEIHGKCFFGLVLLVSLGMRLRRSQEASPAFRGLWGCSRVGASFIFMDLALPTIYARIHELPWLNGLFAQILSLCGINTGWGQAVVSMQSPAGAYAFAISLEKLVPPAALFLLVGALVSILSTNARKRWNVVWLLLASWVMFLIIRMLVFLGIAADGQPLELFYKPIPVLLSLLPLVLFWTLWVDAQIRDNADQASRTPRLLRTDLLCVVTIAVPIFAFVFDDPGTKKPGRVLIDEAHSGWEWTDEPLTTKSYGSKTTYNYYCMAEFLRHYFPQVDRNYRKISPETLRNYDVLILKTPTYVYSPDEVLAIREFVAKGGGVWLIGDHTDVFGTSTCLNQIAESYGITYVADAVDDLPVHERQVYHTSKLGSHPITRGFSETLMATSCSLKISGSVDAAMIGDTLYSDAASYRTYSFFGDHKLDATESFGLFVQAAAVRAGKGRVVAFSDSTTLSNFTFFFPGKWEMTVATVDWLNHSNRGEVFWFGIAAIALVGFVWASAIRKGVGAQLFSIEGVVVGALIGFGGSHGISQLVRPFPAALNPYPVIAFEREHCEYLLPLDHETHDWDANSYHTFFVWTQRLGLIPRVEDSLDRALTRPLVVFIRPRTEFSEASLAKVFEFVGRGGKLLVLDEADDHRSTASQLLSRFGIRFGKALGKSELDLSGVGPFPPATKLEVPSVTEIHGGSPILKTSNGVPVGAIVASGSGVVVVLGVARSYSVDRMGMVKDTLKGDQVALAELQFHVFRDVFQSIGPTPLGTTQNLGEKRFDRTDESLKQGVGLKVLEDNRPHPKHE